MLDTDRKTRSHRFTPCPHSHCSRCSPTSLRPRRASGRSSLRRRPGAPCPPSARFLSHHRRQRIPSPSTSGIPRETRDQRQPRRQQQLEQRQREQAQELVRLLARERSFAITENEQSIAASDAETTVSTDTSANATPLGSGTPTGTVVVPGRDHSGTVVARRIWDVDVGDRSQELPKSGPVMSRSGEYVAALDADIEACIATFERGRARERALPDRFQALEVRDLWVCATRDASTVGSSSGADAREDGMVSILRAVHHPLELARTATRSNTGRRNDGGTIMACSSNSNNTGSSSRNSNSSDSRRRNSKPRRRRRPCALNCLVEGRCAKSPAVRSRTQFVSAPLLARSRAATVPQVGVLPGGDFPRRASAFAGSAACPAATRTTIALRSGALDCVRPVLQDEARRAPRYFGLRERKPAGADDCAPLVAPRARAFAFTVRVCTRALCGSEPARVGRPRSCDGAPGHTVG
ncbi:hypothetical protein DFH11DRAFT_122312 [Phellopilus nigrolimitatus]|nr:hypothetical protein DFH11DRAFT_122312 [Phellopilus nigrolimitatus]